MPTIEIISNTTCRLRGASGLLVRRLDDLLAVEVPGARFAPAYNRGWDGRRHLFSARTGTFPLGLLRRVQEAATGLPVEDLRKEVLPQPDPSVVEPGMVSGVTLRDYQLDTVSKALAAGRGIIWIATNGGKSAIAAAIIKTLRKHRVVYLVHKKVLLAQATIDIARHLGTIPENIGVVGGGRFSPRAVTVATVQSVHRKLKDKKVAEWLATAGVFILDEGHHAQAKTFYEVAMRCGAQFRYILSGTPFGSDEMNLVVEAVAGPVITRVRNEELIAAGVSAKPTIEIVQMDEPEVKGHSWDKVYKEGIVLNAARNALLVDRVAAFVREKLPTLVMVREIWHGDMIATMLKVKGLRHAFVHGKMPLPAIEEKKVAFEEGKLDVLIASPIFDEGVNVPAVRALVIGDGGKSVRALLQKVGRALRRKAGEDNTVRVLDVADMTHPWLAQHSLERIKTYEAENFEIVMSQK